MLSLANSSSRDPSRDNLQLLSQSFAYTIVVCGVCRWQSSQLASVDDAANEDQ